MGEVLGQVLLGAGRSWGRSLLGQVGWWDLGAQGVAAGLSGLRVGLTTHTSASFTLPGGDDV